MRIIEEYSKRDPEHRNLARKGDVLRPPFARHIREPDIKVLGYLLLDRLDADGKAALLMQHVMQKRFHHFHITLPISRNEKGGLKRKSGREWSQVFSQLPCKLFA